MVFTPNVSCVIVLTYIFMSKGRALDMLIRLTVTRRGRRGPIEERSMFSVVCSPDQH